VAQIVPDVRRILSDVGDCAAPDSDSARFRLFESVAAFLERASQARPLVLCFDDLHAADAPSLLLLQFVAGELERMHVLVAGAYRDLDPAVSDQLASTLADVSRHETTRRIALGGLSEGEVGRLVALSGGAGASESVSAVLHASTEGNPLFVVELIRLLAAEGRLEGQSPRLAVPDSIREVIGRRLRHLSSECRRVLTLASIIGREFGLVALERVADYTGIDKLLTVLDEAIAARVVEEIPGALGRLRFGHALIRDTLYEEIPATHRIRLHRRVAEVLEGLYAGSPDAHLAELAHHFSMAVPAAGTDKAIEYSRRAGDRAAGLLAYEEAVRLYETALPLVDEGAARCDLLLALGNAQARAGDTPASKQTYREAADLAEALEVPDHLAHAALGYGGRILWEVSRDDEYLVPLLERALSALGEADSPLRVRLLARLAGGPLRDARFPPERKAALSQEALDMARRIGDPATLAYALAGYIPAHHSPDHTREHEQWATELIETAMEVGDLERAVEGFEHRGQAAIELGNMQGAKADLATMTTLAGRLRQPSQDWFVAELRAQHALLEGRLAEAERLISEALELGQQAQRWNALVSYRIQLYLLRRFQGRLQALDPSDFESPTYPVSYCVLLGLYDELGRTGAARELLATLATDEFSGVPFDEEWLLGMSLLAEVACSLGDTPRMMELYQKLEPYADRVAVGYSEISVGSVSRYLGLLASTLERWEQAERHFEDALQMNEQIGARPWLAHTEEDYGRMLLDRGVRERGSELIAAALETYRELGMEGALARATAPVAK